MALWLMGLCGQGHKLSAILADKTTVSTLGEAMWRIEIYFPLTSLLVTHNYFFFLCSKCIFFVSLIALAVVSKMVGAN